VSSTVSPTSLLPQLRTPWLISSTTTWPSTVVQTWPGWITIWVGVAGSSAMVQWSLPTQTTTSPASSRVGSSPSGLQAGTYFTWATGVMPGLAKVDDRTFVHAMQQMNIAIVNPVFIATFLGAPLLAGASIAVAGSHARPWAIAATVLAVGTLVISFAGNIPLNDALDAAGPVDKIKDLAAVRADFESLWVKLNIARTFTSAGALGALAMAALKSRG
jgi:uncharacterized membrane protein